jgi:two-component system sensor kinase FixL
MENESQALLAAIMETAVDAIIVIDAKGIVQLANPATQTMFGFDNADLIGQNISMLMPAPYQQQHDQYLKNYFESGIAKIIGIGRDVVGKRKNGQEFPMHLAVSEIRVADRLLFAGIIRDITALKDAESELQTANEALEERVRERTDDLHRAQAELVRVEKLATLGQVSGGIAHEIRNPLNAIKTSAYFLLNANSASPAKVNEHLQRIDRQVTVIDHVVTALSDVARLPAPSTSPCDVRIIVRDVIRSTSLSPGIVVDDQLPTLLPPAVVDANQIPIVVKNIIRNAREAMPDGGKLTLAANHDNEAVRLSIADSGSGISPENMSRITEPLFSTKQAGMGLGLAISKTILEQNRGRLEVVSSLGEGSTFTLVLPTTSPTNPA